MSLECPAIGGARNRPSDDPDAARRRLAASIDGIARFIRVTTRMQSRHRARTGLVAKFGRMADSDGVIDRVVPVKSANLLWRQRP
jgi:hypothetical protein